MSAADEQSGSPQAEGAKPEHVVKKALKRKKEAAQGPGAEPVRSGTAHIPSTVMTVEYIDDSEGMNAALGALDKRVARLEQLVGSLEEAHKEMMGTVRDQVKEIRGFAKAVGRRIDAIYKLLSRGMVPTKATESEPAPQRPSPGGPEAGPLVPEQYRDDPEHKKASMIARVMAADLEEYYPESVSEGALYENFFELLEKQIADARKTYLERVPESVASEYDHFSAALQDLVARKKEELRGEQSQ